MVRNPWATRGIHWMEQWAATSKEGANPLNPSVVRIEGCNIFNFDILVEVRYANRPREDGIPSNRVSSSRGEYVPAPCTHRPSSHPNVLTVRPRLLPSSNRKDVRGAKS